MKPLWGIDMGGTKIEGVIIESRDNLNVIYRHRIPTEASQGYEHIIHQFISLIDDMKKQTGLTPDQIGIGIPGVNDPQTNLIKNCNATAVIGMPLKADLEKALKTTIKIANDANCFAVAEANFGAGKEHAPNAESVFGVIMGTGVGGGLVVHNKVLNGKHSIAGEWGHNFLDESGGMCYCGKIGCVETLISGPALERYYFALSGNKLGLKDIYHNHLNNSDEFATKTMRRLIHYFGYAISWIINTIDPDAIVLGGGVGNIDILYSEGVEATKKWVFNTKVDTLFLKPVLGDSAGVFGAALL